jgi:hypothetical protein
MGDPCNHCAVGNIQCIRDEKHERCAECTHHDDQSRNGPVFVPDSKWETLVNAENHINAQLDEKHGLSHSLFSQLLDTVAQIRDTTAQIRRLESQKKTLKERGLGYIRQDRSALKRLESQISEASSASSDEASDGPEVGVDDPASSSTGIVYSFFLAIGRFSCPNTIASCPCAPGIAWF